VITKDILKMSLKNLISEFLSDYDYKQYLLKVISISFQQ